jgi:hypothetical protein
VFGPNSNTDGQNIFFWLLAKFKNEIKNSYLNPRRKQFFAVDSNAQIDFIDFMNFHKMLNLIEINAFITSNLPELTTSLFSFRISEAITLSAPYIFLRECVNSVPFVTSAYD